MEVLKCLSYFFTIFDANGIVANESGAISGMLTLLVGAIILYTIGITIFARMIYIFSCFVIYQVAVNLKIMVEVGKF